MQTGTLLRQMKTNILNICKLKIVGGLQTTGRDITYVSLYHDDYHDSSIREPAGIFIMRDVQTFPDSHRLIGTVVVWQ